MPSAKYKPAIHPFDVEHGTDTSGLLAGDVIARGTGAPPANLTAYYGIAPSILEGLLDIWLQRTHPQHSIEQYTFLDVGAGKGRAMLLAARYPFDTVRGIELSSDLARIAEANIALWRSDTHAASLAPLQLIQADATRHPLPLTPTLAFLFHPFEAPVLRRFLQHIDRSQRRAPHAFDLIYANSEHGSLLDKHPSFQQVWEGRVPMSTQDHVADLAAISQQEEYGSTGDEQCAIYRYMATKKSFTGAQKKRAEKN